MISKDNYLYNPGIGFEYISDKELWGNIFRKPFPSDLYDENKGSVTLSHYFELRKHEKEDGSRCNLLMVRRNFIMTSESKRAKAFIALRSFLIRFNRPFSDICLEIPRHPEVVPKEEYKPIQITFSCPVKFCLNESKDKFSLLLQESLFDELHSYIFNFEFKNKTSNMEYILAFPFWYFRAIVLQY